MPQFIQFGLCNFPERILPPSTTLSKDLGLPAKSGEPENDE